MKHLRPFDAVLLAILVPLWVVCFALHVKEVAHGRLARVPLFVSAPQSADSYPTLLGFWPGSRAETASGLAVGDRLTHLGEADLRGVGPIAFVARAYEQAKGNLSVPVSFVRAGKPGKAELRFDPFVLPWGAVPMTLGFAVTAVLVLLRMPGSRPARAFFLACMSYSTHWCLFFGGPPVQTYAWVAMYFLSSLVIFPFALWAVLVVPEEVAPTNRWMFTWPWLFALRGPTAISWYAGFPLPHKIGMRATHVLEVAFVVTLLAVLTHNFRRAGPLGRRQLKWVVYGLYIGTVPVLAATTLATFEPRLWWLQEASTVALVLTPICFFIAIVRFNLFDIDRLISATAAYTILSVLLTAGGFTVIPRLSQAASMVAGVDPVFGQVAFALLLAVLVVPGQRHLRPQIERLFFVERYALERGVDLLLRELSVCEGPQVLLTLAGERLNTLLRPESCVIYARTGDAYASAFVRGSAVPPLFDVHSPLVRALHTRAAPIEVERWRRTAEARLAPADRAALDSLGAAVVLPVSRGETLAAFFCLGYKRSGDIYTSTDLVLLTAVADKVSGELLRFDEVEIRNQARAMQEALRRYVPEPVAARVVSGQELITEEREISVVFVDIRGYSTYSQERTSEENFSMVNRYTETVSGVVRKYGGVIVEFTGDGMMAIFGAPEVLAQKERAAVEAGREIVATVRALELGRERPESRPLDVGVGIATGEVFVGNIQSVDHWIWTAIGNTANLGARLQSLSRDLGASVVIDTATWRAAGDAVTDFEKREKMTIRGFRQPEDVYLLPLTAPVLRTERSSAASV